MGFKWSPFSNKQLKLLTWWMPENNKKSYNGIIAEGSVRSGKTLILSFSFINWAMASYNGQNFAITGKTIGSLRRNVIVGLKEILFSRGYKVIDRQSQSCLIVAKDKVINTFYLFGGRDERSQDLIQGITLAGVLFDEVALMPESFVNQALARCSVEGAKYWFNCNPEGPKHWFKINHIDKAKEKKYLDIHCNLEDNPSLSKETIEKYYNMFQGVFYQRYILGKWVQASGIIYDTFDAERNTYTDPNVLPIKARENDIPAIYGSDFGTQNPQVYLRAYKIRVPGDPIPFLYVDNEYYYSGRDKLKQMEPRQYVEAFHQFNEGRRYTNIAMDPSATPLIAAHKNAGDRVIQAKNDVAEGIAKVSTLFNTGHLLINANNCPNLISELGMYSWDEKKVENGNEVPIKEFDHCCDALRYIVNTNFSQYEVYGEKLTKRYRRGA